MVASKQINRNSSEQQKEDDVELWRQAVDDIQKLPIEHRQQFHWEKTPETSTWSKEKRVLKKQVYLPTPSKNSLFKVDKHVIRRIRRGNQKIEARLDLHGMTQDEAHRRVGQFIFSASEKGYRYVLVITGKGRPSSGSQTVDGLTSGILRQRLPQWLESADLKRLVIGLEQAERHHGGSGAFYVQLRRRDRAIKRK